MAEIINEKSLTARIAFAGLGAMGHGMAANLRKKGLDLICYARTEEKADSLRSEGFFVTTKKEELAGSSLLFLCLPDEKAVEKFLFEQSETESSCLASLLAPGAIISDHSTIRYQAAVAIHDRLLHEYGVRCLDAPISGMPVRAEAGTLTIMCGGEEDTYQALLPYLQMFGKNILYMGKSGSGQLTKLVNQLLYDINLAALAEVLPMAVKLGLDPEKITEVVNSGTGRSLASEFFLPRTLEGNFTDGYPTAKAYKDLKNAFDILASEGIPMPVFSAAASIYQQAMLMGYGEEAKNSMFHVYEEMLGVEFRKK